VQIAVSAGIINTLINAPLAWALVPADAVLPSWGLPGVASDLVATAFGIAAGTVVVVTPQIRRQLAMGKLAPPSLSPYWRGGFARWPRGALRRALNVGVFTVLISTPLPLMTLALLGSPSLDRLGLTLLKGTFAFVVGALVTPVIAAAATVEKRHHKGRRRDGEV
jgi:hypothetical protein